MGFKFFLKKKITKKRPQKAFSRAYFDAHFFFNFGAAYELRGRERTQSSYGPN